MNLETIKQNLLNAFAQLTVLRMVVSSKSEKVADVPALYALIALLLAAPVCVGVAIIGFATGHRIHFEKIA